MEVVGAAEEDFFSVVGEFVEGNAVGDRAGFDLLVFDFDAEETRAGLGRGGNAAGAVEHEEGLVVDVETGVVAGGDGDFPEAGGETVELDFGIFDFRFLIFTFGGRRSRGGFGVFVVGLFFLVGGRGFFFRRGEFVVGLERGAEGVGGERELVNFHRAVEKRFRLAKAPRGADGALEGAGREKIEPLAVGAPRGIAAIGAFAGDGDGAVAGEAVEPDDGVVVGGTVDEGEPLAVGRPREIGRVEIAFG